jgi:hypothetical protein
MVVVEDRRPSLEHDDALHGSLVLMRTDVDVAFRHESIGERFSLVIALVLQSAVPLRMTIATTVFVSIVVGHLTVSAFVLKTLGISTEVAVFSSILMCLTSLSWMIIATILHVHCKPNYVGERVEETLRKVVEFVFKDI